ncbi:Zn-dependent hydrolase [Aphanothece hegewaldii CCALA 016]|uniref:Zn-dependent hydrolase n=1 Tax=Aphanothece hegewaldii CCALA 016 TaxID=2107694 RepID=A0A2T1LYD5_9CHRO|nr:Zn-dependent hydrolase [Aphanothece hegewaldii]PSF37412.1 Zn-dependent hydrolase [Aphanothece hegewaldii CCALA 016]
MVSSIVKPIVINSDRLLKSIEDLAKIGHLSDGGVCRIAFTPEDLAARNLIQSWMIETGMSVRIDTAGNMIGTYQGKYPQASTLSTGSHIDTVPNGGRYDGAYGVLAGIEVVRVLHEADIRLNHSIEVIVFADEESTMIGSKAMVGKIVNDPNYYTHVDGRDIQTCLEYIGGNWHKIDQARRTNQEMAAFVELHVEQGPVLESMDKKIGVVQGIVGQRRYVITVTGHSSHAGSTPMNMRSDALVAASLIILAVNRIGNTPGQQVATVGKMQVSPNAPNVIPGIVEMSLDIRDLSNEHLDHLMAELIQEIEAIATRTQTQIKLEPCLRNEPAPAASNIQQTIAKICEDFGFSYTYLPSRASHDAQEMANLTDMGMIFVPSIAGISHAQTEYTSPEQCVEGANVLLHTFLRLDQHYSIL